MGKRPSAKLLKHLSKYSTYRAGQNYGKNPQKLLLEWELIEIIDVPKKKGLTCPCGRTGLRYVSLIRNRETRVDTYVGINCVQHFTNNKFVPQLMRVLSQLATSGVPGKYIGKKGKMHRFEISSGNKLVKNMKIFQAFFKQIPIEKCTKHKTFVLSVTRSPRRLPNKDKFTPGAKYNLTVAPMTSRKGGKGAGKSKGGKKRPRLMFFADGVRRTN